MRDRFEQFARHVGPARGDILHLLPVAQRTQTARRHRYRDQQAGQRSDGEGAADDGGAEQHGEGLPVPSAARNFEAEEGKQRHMHRQEAEQEHPDGVMPREKESGCPVKSH